MSRFWERRSETDLERRLRAERAEAPEPLVRMLAERSGARDRRPRLTPRLALVGAVTAVMLAALGAFGTAGYAGAAVRTCASSIHDVINISPAHKPTGGSQTRDPQGHQGKGGKDEDGGGKGNGNGNGNGNGHDDDDDPGDEHPWQDQYHHKWPICHKGKTTLYLPLPAYIAHLMHGDHPGPC